jgi:PAS domain S-box-containing protein
LTGLAVAGGEGFSDRTFLILAAGGAGITALLGALARGRRAVLTLAFVADVAWVSLAVLGAGRAEAGLSLLFALVAFAAGLGLGHVSALAVSGVAGAALVLTGLAGEGGGSGWLVGQGLLVLVLGILSDRTRALLVARERELDQASRALERMRLDTDLIVQNLTSGVISVDGEGCIVHWNEAAAATLGREAQEVKGVPLEEALPEGASPLARLLREGLEQGRALRRVEAELQLRDRRVPLGLGTTVLRDNEGTPSGVVALFQDLTEVRKQEALFRRRDRLAAVGELAAGIAHEIRNSILPASGSVQLLAGELELNGEQARLFDVVERELDNVERFVSGLLRYTRSQSLHLGAFDLGEAAREAAQDLQLSVPDTVGVEVEGAPAAARADRDQLRAVLRNLLLNAVEAAGPAGRIRIRTGSDGEGRPWVEVEDDGPGVKAEDRERVFEPFFTGKAGGTGLGLAIVARIVEDHDGELRLLESERGGARFRVILPSAEAEPALVRAA